MNYVPKHYRKWWLSHPRARFTHSVTVQLHSIIAKAVREVRMERGLR